MDKAKTAIGDFMGRSGKHDTTVHETVSPSVQHETVKPHHHEELNTAVDKEVHQDHYHRTVQPVHDREVLPEQHHAKLGGVQHREFDHRDHEGTKRHLADDQAGFKDERVVHDTTHSQSSAPVVGGEHVHHHIHETIQPVVHKETVQPHVTHTTVPIHETHHNSAKHHETSHLPAMPLSEFKSKGGVLGGREERYDGFEGEPKHIGGTVGGLVGGNKHHTGHASEAVRREGTHGDYDPLDGRHSHGTRHAEPGLGSNTTSGNIRGVEESGPVGQPVGSGLDKTGSGKTKKPSIMDKLNPKVDADGDGKAGFMH